MTAFEIKNISDNQDLIDQLLDQWSEDISTFFPDFDPLDLSFTITLALIIDKQAAGLFMYEEKGKEIHIELDFLSDNYRDQGIGQALFHELKDRFKKEGFVKIIALKYNEDHGNYLKLLGFKESERISSRYEMNLR